MFNKPSTIISTVASISALTLSMFTPLVLANSYILAVKNCAAYNSHNFRPFSTVRIGEKYLLRGVTSFDDGERGAIIYAHRNTPSGREEGTVIVRASCFQSDRQGVIRY